MQYIFMPNNCLGYVFSYNGETHELCLIDTTILIHYLYTYSYIYHSKIYF